MCDGTERSFCSAAAHSGGSRVVMYVLTQIPFDELQALTVSYGETVGLV